MLARVYAIALNSYRESVRARVLYGLLGLAIATSAYSVVIAKLSLHQEARVVADIGAASMSLYAVLVAVIVSATSLYRELENKTVFPILSRPLRRYEYLIGKYVGTLITLFVFLAIDGAVVFFLLAIFAGVPPARIAISAIAVFALLGVTLARARHSRVFVIIPWALVFVAVAFMLARQGGAERQLVAASAILTLGEVAIVSAVATLFASFSSPFLTVLFTLGIFALGRSADTLARIPAALFGHQVQRAGGVLARIVPNLQLYVPARPLLLGEVAGAPVWSYVARASIHAFFYASVLVVLSAAIFQKRDFQ